MVVQAVAWITSVNGFQKLGTKAARRSDLRDERKLRA